MINFSPEHKYNMKWPTTPMDFEIEILNPFGSNFLDDSSASTSSNRIVFTKNNNNGISEPSTMAKVSTAFDQISMNFPEIFAEPVELSVEIFAEPEELSSPEIQPTPSFPPRVLNASNVFQSISSVDPSTIIFESSAPKSSKKVKQPAAQRNRAIQSMPFDFEKLITTLSTVIKQEYKRAGFYQLESGAFKNHCEVSAHWERQHRNVNFGTLANKQQKKIKSLGTKYYENLLGLLNLEWLEVKALPDAKTTKKS